MSKKRLLRTLDLYAGIGGIRLGFEQAGGFETVFANDYEQACSFTYDLNFSEPNLTIGDIGIVDYEKLPDFDFLLAGFPCQPFSVAGYQKGFEDQNRGNQFFNIVRILDTKIKLGKKPTGFLLENVKNLKGHDGGKTFRIIEEALASLGYHTKSKIMSSMEYGNIPQSRERIYIVGFDSDEAREKFNWPEPIKLTKKPKDFLSDNVDQKYYYNGKPLYKKLKQRVNSSDSIYQWRRQYVRENKRGVCPTLTANMGMGGHNVPIVKDDDGIRKLTPLECVRLQGFPRNYKLPKDLRDSRLYKQAGNSVVVPVIKRIAEQIKLAIE